MALCLFVAVTACKKDTKKPDTTPDPVVVPTPTTGSLKIEFEHVVDTLPLVFNQSYVNPKGDTFQVSKFNYFISNIVITNADNTTFTEPNSYHLVKHSDEASTFITIPNIPLGSYKSIKFMLGVDSARNVSGAQTGDLDLAKSGDMFWSWNTGYIFFKLEGTSPKSGDAQKSLTYHIGGFGGPYKGQRIFDLGFQGTTANITAAITPLVHLSVNVNEFFKTPTLIDVSTLYNHMSPTIANNKVFADNYADMISFEHVHNY